MDNSSCKRALLSVFDKTGIVEFAKALQSLGFEIITTGGTAKILNDNQIPFITVESITNFPELLGGRVKTLHPNIHAGILQRGKIDQQTLNKHQINPINLVAVNLYPFAKVIADENTDLAQAIEQIDIGGVSLLRSAAKNHQEVIAVSDPNDYQQIIDQLKNNQLTLSLREKYAYKAFCHTAQYDQTIARYFGKKFNQDDLPDALSTPLEKIADLRYGENPQQKAQLYQFLPIIDQSLTNANKIQGKDLSFNNYADANCALETILKFDLPACAIVKHANPCGVAVRDDLLLAYQAAYQCDPQSAFGGIIAFNQKVNADLADKIINQQFVEVIIAPEFCPQSLAIFAKKPNLRILKTNPQKTPTLNWQIHSIRGGLLVQSCDNLTKDEYQVVGKITPTKQQWQDLLFAWEVAKNVKSNAMILAKNQATIGIGAGQSSRVFAGKIALLRAQEAGFSSENSVLASDAFLPFKDNVEIMAKAGIKAIIQPKGSIRDQEVIDCANEHEIALVFANNRHFKH